VLAARVAALGSLTGEARAGRADGRTELHYRMAAPNADAIDALEAPERHLRVDRQRWATGALWLQSGLCPIFGAPSPASSSAEPAGTEETGALDLPPRTQLLQPSGTSQLVHLAHHRAHFVFVA
jgi:hypothetical protein